MIQELERLNYGFQKNYNTNQGEKMRYKIFITICSVYIFLASKTLDCKILIPPRYEVNFIVSNEPISSDSLVLTESGDKAGTVLDFVTLEPKTNF